MRVDWCVSSWFRIKNTHSLTFGYTVPLVLCERVVIFFLCVHGAKCIAVLNGVA